MAASTKDEQSDAKFQRFAASLERALKSFEVTKEWHDLISSMARLNKVLLAYSHIRMLPQKYLLAKRLAQCLHPSLPGGVHLKTLDVYKAIFGRIGPDGLAEDLFVYCSGLFPLFDYASMQVRPVVLDLYEQYLLPLGPRLIPALQGLILSLLPGLEDESEHTERVGLMLDAICQACEDTPTFCAVMWNILISSPSSRLPAANYVLLHLTKSTSMAKAFQAKDERTVSLMVSALCSAVLDSSILVERLALDIIAMVFPLHQPHATPSQLIQLVSASLLCLLKRDVSLNRRFFSWVLGMGVAMAADIAPSNVFDALSSVYFNTHAKGYMISAIRTIFSQGLVAAGSDDKMVCLLPYKLVRTLLDKPEVATVVSDILEHVVRCFVSQLQQLGSFADEKQDSPSSCCPSSAAAADGKVMGKRALRSEIVYTGSQLLMTIDSVVLWGWMETFLLGKISKAHVISPGDTDQTRASNAATGASDDDLKDRLHLVQYLLSVLPLGSMDSALSFHLPLLLTHLMTAINYSLPCPPFSLSGTMLPLACEFCLQFLSTIQRYSVSNSSSTSIAGSPATPIQGLPGAVMRDGEGALLLSTGGNLSLGPAIVAEPGGLMAELVHQCQRLVQLIITKVSIQGSEKEEERADLTQHLAHHIQLVTKKFGCGRGTGRENVTTMAKLDPRISKCFHSACSCLLVAARLSLDMPTTTSSTATYDGSSGWIDALMLGCLCLQSSHLMIVSMDTLLSLRRMCPEIRRGISPSRTMSTGVAMVATLLAKRKDFIKAVTVLLWTLLSTSCPFYEEAACLLMKLYSLGQCSGAIEGVLLESFTATTEEAYEHYSILWRYSLVQHLHQGPLAMKRVTLRFLEGLHSHHPHIRRTLEAWLTLVCQKKQLHLALHAVYNLVTEACPERQDTHLPAPRESCEADPPRLHYWKKEEEEEQKEDGSEAEQTKKPLLPYPSYFLSELVDGPRLQYALSLLQSVFDFDGCTVCMALINSQASDPHVLAPALEEVGSFLEMTATVEAGRPRSPMAMRPLASQRSLLELILSESVAILLSEYAEPVSPTETDLVSLFEAKTGAAVLVCKVLTSFVALLSRHQSAITAEGGHPTKLENPGFVFSLVTLCEVQKGCLLSLGHLVQSVLGEGSSLLPHDRDGGSIAVSWSGFQQTSFFVQKMEPLFVQLLRMASIIIVLDSLCTTMKVSNAAQLLHSTEKSKSNANLSVLPGYGLTSQPLFLKLVVQVLSLDVFSPIHSTLLRVLCASLPYLHVHLETIASKVVKQICKNISKLLSNSCGPADGHKERHPGYTPRSPGQMDCESVVCHMEALMAIVNFCLFGSDIFEDENSQAAISPYHRGPNSLYDITKPSLPCRNDPQEASASADRTTAGALSWLLGTMFGTGSEESHVPEQSEEVYTGLASSAGKKMLVMLPAVYRALAHLWKQCCCSGNRSNSSYQNTHLAKDMKYLITKMLRPFLSQQHVLFYSSISHVWLQWNLSGKDKKKKLLREDFLEMLHDLKLQRLKDMLPCIKQTVSYLGKDRDPQLAVERQKYLLHFLYRYLHSSCQSLEELSDCMMDLVGLLRDCYQLFILGTESVASNILLVCMLTSILHVLVCRVPPPDPKSRKKDRKSLQDLIHRLCECLAQSFASGLESIHSSATSKTMPISEPHPHSFKTSTSIASSFSTALQEKPKVREESSAPPATASTVSSSQRPEKAAKGIRDLLPDELQVSVAREDELTVVGFKEDLLSQNVLCQTSQIPKEVHALAILSQVICHFIDYAYITAEKDRVHSLLKAVFRSVWPILREQRNVMSICRQHSVHLLATLSSFQVTRRSWKDETMDIFLGPSFFITDESSLLEWRTIIDNLVSQDKMVFSSLFSRLPASSYPAAGVVNIFSSQEQEKVQRSRLMKRIAFVLLAGEKDQYGAYHPQINEKLAEALRCYAGPVISAEVFLTFRVMLLQLSSDHLISLWPALLSELISTLDNMADDLLLELQGQVSEWPKEMLHCYLSACKLLDTALALPPSLLPHLQFMSWEFTRSDSGIVGKILTAFTLHSNVSDGEEDSTNPPPLLFQLPSHPPFLAINSLPSLSSLYPFFCKISLHHTAITNMPTTASLSREADQTIKRIQRQLLCDFLEMA